MKHNLNVKCQNSKLSAYGRSTVGGKVIAQKLKIDKSNEQPVTSNEYNLPKANNKNVK